MLVMDPYARSSCGNDDNGSERLNDEFVVNNGFQARPRNGSSSYSSSLVLDSERGELVEANVKLQRKGVSVERTVAASKNHIEAERKRRRRINGHLDTLRSLIPGAKKMDKATLLTEVVGHLKEQKKNATEANESFFMPTDIDEVKVEQQEDGSDGAPHFRASLCCNYKPGLLSDLRKVLDALHLIIVKAEIATLEGRMKNVFVMASCKERKFENTEVCQSLMSSVQQAFRSVLNKFSATEEFLLGARLSNKRRRVSLFDSSLSSSSGYL